MKNVMILRKFLIGLVLGGCFLANAKPGEPELVFDENDPEVAVGIKVNLPDAIANRIILDYLKCDCPDDFDGTQEQFNELGLSLKENCKLLADYIIQQYMRNDLYVPGFVLEDNFLQKLKLQSQKSPVFQLSCYFKHLNSIRSNH